MENFEIVATQGHISFDLTALKEELKAIAEQYEGIVFSEDSIKIAKDDKARLNKIRTEIETRRKEIKKSWNEPYVEFEKQVKEALSIIDKPIGDIDSKLKEYEEKRKEEKKIHCQELFNEKVGEYANVLDYDKVFNAKWLNGTTTDKDILFDISTAVTQVKIDMESIKALGSEIEDKLIEAYKIGGLASAIKRNQDYIQTKMLAEQKVKEEQARKEQEIKEQEEPEIKEPTRIVPVDVSTGEILETWDITIIGKKNIDAVRDFLFINDINYSEDIDDLK